MRKETLRVLLISAIAIVLLNINAFFGPANMKEGLKNGIFILLAIILLANFLVRKRKIKAEVQLNRAKFKDETALNLDVLVSQLTHTMKVASKEVDSFRETYQPKTRNDLWKISTNPSIPEVDREIASQLLAHMPN